MSAAYGISDADVRAPASPEDLCAELAAARAAGAAVLPQGAGSRAGPGATPSRVDRILSTRALDAIVAYEPGDLTITVQAGCPLRALHGALAAHDQCLPLAGCRSDGPDGTVGGLIATAADGLLDHGSGRVRDALIGCTLALADGSLARGRGRVVKNVAGYDLPRMLVGSLGTLGILVEASFKLQPRPARRATLVVELPDAASTWEAERRVADAPVQPAFLDVLLGQGRPRLALGFDGSIPRVDGQIALVAALLAPSTATELPESEARALRARLDTPHAPLLVRVGSLPTRLRGIVEAGLALAADRGLVATADARPAGGLAFLRLTKAAPDDLRALLTTLRRDATAVLVSAHEELATPADVWGPPPEDQPLMAAVKAALDPDGVFAAGRHVGGL